MAKDLRGGIEKAKDNAKDKGRHCNGCRQVGQSCNKRNCPLLIKRSVGIKETNMNSSDSDNGN